MDNQQISNIELLNEIKKLQAQILNLEQKVDGANSVLNNHIEFIDGVFDYIKKPLFFLMNKVNNLLLLDEKIYLKDKGFNRTKNILYLRN